MFGYYPYGFYMDPGYFLVIIAAILSLIASARVSSTFKKRINLITFLESDDQFVNHQPILLYR